jgi:hypothetical protein
MNMEAQWENKMWVRDGSTGDGEPMFLSVHWKNTLFWVWDKIKSPSLDKG